MDNVTKLKAVNQSLKSELGTAKSALLDYKVCLLYTSGTGWGERSWQKYKTTRI